MGINDAQLTVEIIAETSQFQKGTQDAAKTITDFSNQGTKAVAQLHNAQKTWTADLAKGQARGQLRLVAMEMGNLAGAGGAAGRAMGSLMAIMGTGGLVGVLALAATGIGFLVQNQRQAGEEAKKAAAENNQLAAAFEAAAKTGIKLTEAQVALFAVTKKQQLQAQAAGIVVLEEELEALNATYARQNKVLAENEAALKAGASVYGMGWVKKNLEATSDKIIKVTSDLEAARKGFNDTADAMKKMADAAKDMNEVIVPDDLAESSLYWQNQQAELEKTAQLMKRLNELRGTASKKASQEHAKNWKAAEDSFMSSTAGMQSATANLFSTFLTGSASAEEAWKTFTDSFVKAAVDAMVNVAVQALFKLIGTAILGPGFGAAAAVIPGFAEGNARVTKPTLAVIGEGSEPENVLTDSQLAAASGGGIQVGSISLSYNGPGTENDRVRFVGQSVQDFLKLVARARARTGRRYAHGGA